MAAQGHITAETARFFNPGLRLFQHQREAIDIGLRGESYVVTTGTGSGKSLTYLVPIFDAIMRSDPSRHTVRALLVYPMNALINSQLDALRNFQERNFPDSLVRFERYTGQDRDELRERVKNDPPHILLTNYVMAEYMLLRPSERPLLQTATHDLRTLVMDELHFYRGRQGADVAMLTRRLQESAGRDLQAVATSATMVSGGSRADRNEDVANLASRFFGLDILAANVVDETLRQVSQVPVPESTSDLRAAVETPPPSADVQSVCQHPLAAWAEQAFGLEYEDDRLVRRPPGTFEAAVQRLATESGLPPDRCRDQLRTILEAGSEARLDDGNAVFAFRLHQWLSSGNSIYATLEPPETREFRMEAQYRADNERVLFPLAFCRECGQEYYLVSRIEEQGVGHLLPRAPMAGASEEDLGGQDGFFAVEDGDLWAADLEELPDFWVNERRAGRVIRPEYAEDIPQRHVAMPDGRLDRLNDAGTVGWFQPSPFLLCLRCRVVYDRRGSDFRKLSPLTQTGRSTATTVGVNAAVAGMASQGLPAKEAKSLSFTDNRQDASLQAGHLNDFVQVAQLRAGIVEAVRRGGPLTFDQLGSAVFEALDLRPSDFLREPVDSGPGYEQGRRVMIELLEYRALEDLSRGWRIAQPNLEQTGLLRIEYEGLADLASDHSRWRDLPAMGTASSAMRAAVLKAFVDHLRMQLVIDAQSLTADATHQLSRRASQWLRDPWRLDEQDNLRTQGLALLPGIQPTAGENRQRGVLRLGIRSAITRYLRSASTWGNQENLPADQAEALVGGIVEALRGHILITVPHNASGPRGVRVLAAAMRWCPGDGTPMPPDPVRSRSLHLRREIPGMGQANTYFANLYRENARHLRGMLAAEHTGQVTAEARQEREGQFVDGQLPALFCSPTMELGVDISELHTVHMRNVPPTPANYAQRSGRAGRGGRPALIVAFAAQGNAHDQYFFNQRDQMIAGAVTPSRMDLQNEELIRAHLYSTWLSMTGLSLGSSMSEVLDFSDSKLPITPEKHSAIEVSQLEHTFNRTVELSKGIVRRAQDIRTAGWYSEDWIEDTLRSAPERLDKSLDTWRELYHSACSLRDQSRRISDDPHASRQEREEAERREREARREIMLLLNQTNRQDESDFYPYRYLAGEGFLPGYNFPRLPVRVSVRVGDGAQLIDRPRFLGLSEFGPGNQVYHEGRKHRIHSAVLPPAGVEGRLSRLRICNVCGYAHEGNVTDIELCEHCGTRMDGANSQFLQRLLSQPMMRARSVERISSEEEERIRSGYFITTHFSLPGSRSRQAQSQSSEGSAVLDLFYAPAARLWRINHGWRRGDRVGFTIDPQTGRWATRGAQDEEGDPEPGIPQPISGIKTFVQDGRNILMLQPVCDDSSRDFHLSLLYALKRAIQFVYQVEEQEVGAELVGQGEHLRLLFWEEAEGGTGVWERVVREPRGLAEIAEQALHLCHFDPATGEEAEQHDPEKCTVACYDCLLSYSNQLNHRHIDRRRLPVYLRLLASATTVRMRERDYDEHYRWLEGLIDPNSSLEKEFLAFLHERRLKLPDNAQNRPLTDVHVQPDFYYDREDLPGVCVFVDGPHHDAPAQQQADVQVRDELRERGFRIISIRYDTPFTDQVQAYHEVFTPEAS